VLKKNSPIVPDTEIIKPGTIKLEKEDNRPVQETETKFKF